MAIQGYSILTAWSWREWSRDREVSAIELLEEAIERAERVNPQINAVVYPYYDEARERAYAGLPDGPFTGVPFLLKDLYLLYAGQPMSNGSRIFADYVPDHDHEMTTRYKAAGLSIFGRSTSPEFGITATTESIVHGKTRNPWNLEHTAGGSSGGAAAAVAAGILPIANASDGGGSIRIPAACCGCSDSSRHALAPPPDRTSARAGPGSRRSTPSPAASATQPRCSTRQPVPTSAPRTTLLRRSVPGSTRLAETRAICASASLRPPSTASRRIPTASQPSITPPTSADSLGWRSRKRSWKSPKNCASPSGMSFAPARWSQSRTERPSSDANRIPKTSSRSPGK